MNFEFLRSYLFSSNGKFITFVLVISIQLILGFAPLPMNFASLLSIAFTFLSLSIIVELKGLAYWWIIMGFLGSWVGLGIIIFGVKGRPEQPLNLTTGKLIVFMVISAVVAYGYVQAMTLLYQYAQAKLGTL